MKEIIPIKITIKPNNISVIIWSFSSIKILLQSINITTSQSGAKDRKNILNVNKDDISFYLCHVFNPSTSTEFSSIISHIALLHNTLTSLSAFSFFVVSNFLSCVNGIPNR